MDYSGVERTQSLTVRLFMFEKKFQSAQVAILFQEKTNQVSKEGEYCSDQQAEDFKTFI